MNRRVLVPILWPLVLLFSGWMSQSVVSLQREQRLQQTILGQQRLRLDSLRAQVVAGRVAEGNHKGLVDDFASLTELHDSDPFQNPNTPSGSAQVASLVSGIQTELDLTPAAGLPEPLEFLSVSPGEGQRLPPFVALEFDLNLRGKFASMPRFLDSLVDIGRRKKLVVSVSGLEVHSTETIGQLLITLSVRAYFRE